MKIRIGSKMHNLVTRPHESLSLSASPYEHLQSSDQFVLSLKASSGGCIIAHTHLLAIAAYSASEFGIAANSRSTRVTMDPSVLKARSFNSSRKASCGNANSYSALNYTTAHVHANVECAARGCREAYARAALVHGQSWIEWTLQTKQRKPGTGDHLTPASEMCFGQRSNYGPILIIGTCPGHLPCGTLRSNSSARWRHRYLHIPSTPNGL